MKRKYKKPAVESEGVFEQTSLQCNVSYFPMTSDCDWGQNIIPGWEVCVSYVSKGGNFHEPCDQFVNGEWNCWVALS